jgi:hypothetical protein
MEMTMKCRKISWYRNGAVALALAIACVVSAPALADDVLIASGSNGAEWRYTHPTANLGTEWKNVGYNDSAWASGGSLISRDGDTWDPDEVDWDGPPITTLTLADIGTPRYPSFYFRHEFAVEDPCVYGLLKMRIIRDDGCIVFLNGVEVIRSKIPADMEGSEIDYDYFTDDPVSENDERNWQEFEVDPRFLVAAPTMNIIAVEVHQSSSTSSDLSFALELDGTPTEVAPQAPADDSLSAGLVPNLQVTVKDIENGNPVTVKWYGRVGASIEEEFTIVALPDTQKYSKDHPEIFSRQTGWIKYIADAMNIVFVTHEGDIIETMPTTENPDPWDIRHEEWGNALTSILILKNAGIPYGLAPGNHDEPLELQDEEFPNCFDTLFQPGMQGEFVPAAQCFNGNSANNYQFFTAGGLEFMILHLRFDPWQYGDVNDEDSIAYWAKDAIDENDTKRVIVTTHGYMDTNTNLINNSGQMSTQLVAACPNVDFVLCGHVPGASKESERYTSPRVVHELLADYQEWSNGVNGYLRIMHFVPWQNLVYVDTYSPWLGDYLDDGANRFTLKYVMTNTFMEIGTQANVASGSTVSLPWNGLSEHVTYQWYVTVTDSLGNERGGPLRQFLTNTTPLAENDVVIIPPPGAQTLIAALDNDWDPDNEDSIEFLEFTSQPQNGVAEIIGSGMFYTPNSGFTGTDTFTYTVIDNHGAVSDAATVTVTIDTQPVAVNDSANAVPSEPQSISVMQNDSDPDSGDSIGLHAIVSSPQNGVATINGSVISYTGGNTYWGIDTFTYTIHDNHGAVSDAATVTVTVDYPPVAEADSFNVITGVKTLLGVEYNDWDPDDTVEGIESFTQAAHGTVAIEGSGLFYTPTYGYTGPDSFTYRVIDGLGIVSDWATVTLNVTWY